MNKSNFFEVLHKKNNHLLKADIEQSLNSIIEHISDTLVSGNRVEIRGFGTFSIKHRNQRIGRNPKTGEEVPISARHVVTFRASNVLKSKVDSKNKILKNSQ